MVLSTIKRLACIARKTSHFIILEGDIQSHVITMSTWSTDSSVSLLLPEYHLYMGKLLSHKSSQTHYIQQWVKWGKRKYFLLSLNTGTHTQPYTYMASKKTCMVHSFCDLILKLAMKWMYYFPSLVTAEGYFYSHPAPQMVSNLLTVGWHTPQF